MSAGPRTSHEVVPTHPILIGYAFWLLGIFGAHRFYFGKPITGVLYLLTGGVFLVGWIVDLFLIPAMSAQAAGRYHSGRSDHTIAWVLLTFVGWLGIHRFYIGKYFTGILYALTGGLLGLGIVYDFLTLNTQVEQQNALDQARWDYEVWQMKV
ncbi:MAG: TM2 domain-containing protein [Planctomycetota bacterium]